jgi:hypothetical protein
MKEAFIKIHYTGPAGRVEQAGSFPIRGKRPEEIALDWWEKNVGRGYERKLDKVILNGEEDITEKVLEEQKARWYKLELPF